MARDPGPDLPGDANFRAASETITLNTPAGQVVVSVIPLSIDEQRNIHHNQLRYAELQRLRAGQPNQYEQTRYRH